MSPPDLKDALRLVETLALAPLARSETTRPKSHFGSGGAYTKWASADREVQRYVISKLQEHGAHIGLGDGARIRFAGVTGSSTMGLRSALRNWKAGVERRLADRKATR